MNVRAFVPRLLWLAVLVIAVSACSSSKNNSSASNTAATEEPSAAATVAASSASAAVSATISAKPAGSSSAAPAKAVAAGDLDLTVTAVRAVDTKPFDKFNSADIAVDIQVLNSRGDTAAFSPVFDLKLVDSNGTAHEPELFCTKCPDEFKDANLNKGETAKGTVYFTLKGATSQELDYQRFSEPKVAIPVAQVQSKPAQSAATADPKSPDCVYSAKVSEAFLGFLGGVFSLFDLTPGPTTEAGSTPTLSNDQAKKAVDTLLTAATASNNALKKVTPPNDFKAYHADLVKQFDAMIQQLKDAQKAVAAGDTSKAQSLLSGNSIFDDPNQALATKYAPLTERLNACPNPLGDLSGKP